MFLSEGFDGYANDAALTATGWAITDTAANVEVGGQWTLYNPDHTNKSRYSPPGANGSPTAGGTRFICSNSGTLGPRAAHCLTRPTAARRTICTPRRLRPSAATRSGCTRTSARC